MGKNGKNKSKKNNKPAMASAEDDDRFAAALTRPQFRVKSQEKKSKVVLDERFASVLTDERFQLQERDKYGRKKSKKQQAKDELSEFYTVVDEKEDDKKKEHQSNDDDSSTSSSSSSGEKSSNKKKGKKKSRKDDEDEDINADPASRISYLTALSRGELDVSSSSEDEDSDEDSSSDDDSSLEGEDPVHGTAGVLDPSTKADEEIEITYEDSPYLAVTNLDWTHVRAVDIFVLLSSFTSPGAVKRVQVFPSDFGMKKMEHELKHGPPSLWKKKKNKKAEDEEHDSEQEEDEANNNSESDDEEEGSDGENIQEKTEDGDSQSEVGSEDLDILPTTDEDVMEKYAELIKSANEQPADSDFDPEKLRAYEASKLKYYFAVAEFTSAEHADVAYKEVDGMEFEHSSAAADLRSIPKDEIDNVVNGRTARDEATSVPSNYVPPEFVVSALQQTNVQCTWEAGDTERERALTKYTSAEQWAAAAENDDLKAYLASDQSSDDESEDEKQQKGAKLRRMLGLDDSDDEDGADGGNAESDVESAASDEEEDNEVSKEFTYVPGAKSLEDKIRTKLQSKEEKEELTPWEKYQQKRKEKRREKRQAARRQPTDSDISEDRGNQAGENDDDFFSREYSEDDQREKMSNEELELMLAGENDEEVARDYDMRGIQRIEKNKEKKLRGARKRKEDKLKAEISGQDFAIDLKDERFVAVLDGDDGRFGIDRTDPQYKETAAMRQILDEQKARRKKKRRKVSTEPQKVPPNVVEGSNNEKSAGSAALSSLVKSLKTKVSGKVQ